MDSFSGVQARMADEQPALCGPLTGHVLGDHLAGIAAAEVLQQISEWLEKISTQSSCPLPQCLDTIDRLDRLSHHHQLRLQPQSLELQRLHRLDDSPLGQANFGCWQALGDAYGRCLGRAAASCDFDEQLPLLAVRQLHALGQQLEWRLLQYAPVEQRIWHDLGQCYQLAENAAATDQACQVHAGRHGLSTPRQELLSPLMLAVAAPGALTPKEIHIAARLASHFAHGFILQATPSPDCPFAFDLSAAAAPARLASNLPTSPSMRYFGLGTASEAWHAMLDQVKRQGRIPSGLGLAQGCDPAELLSTMEHLELHWSGMQHPRRGQRRTASVSLSVIPGLVQNARWLAQLRQPGKPAQAIPPIQAQSWQLTDVGEMASAPFCLTGFPTR